MQMSGGHLPAAGWTAAAPYVPAKRERQSSPVDGGSEKEEAKASSFYLVYAGLEPIQTQDSGGALLAAGRM